MQTYDPNVSELATPIPMASAAAEQPKREESRGVPTGLIREEKNLDESQMAEFSSALDEVMPGPGRMMQDEVQGSPYEQAPPQKKATKSPKGDGKNPFGLTDEQYYAALAGVAAIIAFSKPVQSRMRTMVPKFVGESGDVSLTGLVVTALVAAIVFYFAKKFIADKV